VPVVDGTTTFHIMTEDGPKSHSLNAGMVVIVPRGRGAGSRPRMGSA
jgi:hypothetical protein